jgi:hypothetical protein
MGSGLKRHCEACTRHDVASEAHWLGLYNRLSEVLGREHADTFVTSLATKADLAELATRTDLAELRADLRVEMAALRAEVAEMIARQGRTYAITLATSMVGLTGIFSAVVAVIR